MIYNFDFWLTTYCQAKCRSCARTNIHTGDQESWLNTSHMKLETFVNRLEPFPHEIGYIQFCGEMGDPCMHPKICLLYTSPSPRDATLSRMPSSA